MRRILLTCSLALPATAWAQPAPTTTASNDAPPPSAPAAPVPAPPDTKVAQAPDPAAAATAPSPSRPSVEVHGFASLAYSYNSEDTPDHVNPLRTFDTNYDTASIDVVELAVLRTVAKQNDLGFRVDAVAGSTVPHVEAAIGLFRDPSTGQAGDFDLQQAYASYKPADAVTVDLGKFVTPVGYEVIEGWDGWNDHYSHSYLFGYAIPFTHTGGRVAYVRGDLTYTAYVVNGWDNATTADFGKTGALDVSYAHGPATVALTYMGGKESDGWRQLVDAVAIYKLGTQAVLGVNADYGTGGDRSGADKMSAATWYGAAAYATYSLATKVTLALRGEVFDDADGYRTGTAQTLEEGTATVQVHLSDDAHVRAELRVDHSDEMAFGGGNASHEVTAAVNALAKF